VIGMTPSRSRVRTDRIDLVYYAPHLPVGKRVRERPGRHPFYTRLNQRRAEHHFDDFIEGQCQPFYAALSKMKIICSPEIVRLARRDATRGETWVVSIGVNCDNYICDHKRVQFEVGWQPGNTNMVRQLAKNRLRSQCSTRGFSELST